MLKPNAFYQRLQGSYLFSTIAGKVADFSNEHPDAEILRLGIGDVTRPLTPHIIASLHKAVDEMASPESFHGYAPDRGYPFLREAIVAEYRSRKCTIDPDEIFVSDGAKSDSGNIQEIFSPDAKVAVCDPVYPVYIDSNVMAGRSGEWDKEKEAYQEIIYLPCIEENNFLPMLPKGPSPDLIYLCFPNNPTGSVITTEELQKWVDYANEHQSVIIYDAAYEAYISEKDIPHSIYECEGAESCAIEIRSFSKNAGFTGVRLGFTVIPKALKADGVALNDLWARRHGTKYNGAPYIIQRAGEAVFSEEGQKEVRSLVSYYMENARMIREALKDMGYRVYGGVNAPYIWLKTPGKMTSWEFFDLLLQEAQVVGTPGVGFGSHGEGFFRLTAFGSRENSTRAMERIKTLPL